jgi:ABC-type multidrug transport system ATPase subunit
MNETFGGLFLAPLKKLPTLFSRKKPAEEALRPLVRDFSGSVRDGEMLLVLGRPGSGCSTFLKTIASQTEGYEEVQGEITYGGLSAKEVKEKYRGEVVYNQGSSCNMAKSRG